MTRARTASRRAGFTLVELMVALTLLGMFVLTAYAIGTTAARDFQREERVGQLQLGVRMALERVRRDVQLAGHYSVPDTATLTNVCLAPPRRLFALRVFHDDAGGRAALSTMTGAAASRVQADRIRIVGNLETEDGYLAQDISGTRMFLQPTRQSFRHSFADATGVSIDATLFQEAFTPGTLLHVEVNGVHSFVTVTSASLVGGRPIVNFTPALNCQAFGLTGLLTGANVSPLTEVEYAIAPPPAGFPATRDTAVTGTNTVLVRREFNPATGVLLNERVILEYAIDFDTDLLVNTAAAGLPPTLVLRDDAAAAAFSTASPRNVVGVTVSISARTPEQDPRFPWPAGWAAGRPVGAPLNRFLVFTGRDGAARVRSATAEIALPNFIFGGAS